MGAMAKLDHVIYHMCNPCPEGEEVRAVSMHPTEYLASIGLTYERAEPNSFQECWHLFGVTGLPDPKPDWFTIVVGK